MKKVTIGHLSHGVVNTGGFVHEQSLLEALREYVTNSNYAPVTKTVRTNKVYIALNHFKLLWWGFRNTYFDINIVVARCAISAMLRNILLRKKVIIVLHNFDETDKKGFSLNLYYKLLFLLLKKTKSKNVAVCAVAPFWVDFFRQKIDNKNVPVFLYPNLFDNSKYIKYRTEKKKKQIHLGQYSWKNNPQVFNLAKRLNSVGYNCYFTTLIESEKAKFPEYEIRYVSFDNYLTDMALSEYTLAYIGINEGWNRVAHESILVGTQVIGVNKGGLANLLILSGSYIANTEDDFVAIVEQKRTSVINEGFIKRYDISTRQEWIEPIGLFAIS